MSNSTRTTCVIVDDHEVVRAGTRSRLDHLEWLDIVGEAASAAEAHELVEALRPALVLMDIRLPDGNGMDVARIWLETEHETRFVLFSGSATTRQAEQALEAGVSGFVLKDSSLECLIAALVAARDGRRYLDPTIAADMLAPSASAAHRLSAREMEILVLMADGMQNAGIAHRLGISAETVKAHVSNVLVKFDADGRTQAVAMALRMGIIE